MLRITAYADRLLEDLEGLEWDENIKDMQRNWIGKSEGAMVSFQIQGVLLRFYLLRQYKVACTAFELWYVFARTALWLDNISTEVTSVSTNFIRARISATQPLWQCIALIIDLWCGLCISGNEESLEVFTTRPDTLFGATYMVIAPEHPQLQKLTTAENESTVQAYVKAAASKSDLERTELQKEKSGVFTGILKS